jgi:site-specific recombinase XerD
LPACVRDHAILLLLARLGLRPADVANLRLEDLDWEGARLRVVGKSRREDWLPLPQDVGDAILRYMEEARPDAADDHVFLTSQAPIGPLATTTVGAAVFRTVQRTGVRTRSKGAYILRHSAAVELLRQGASLGQIGVILRHRSVNTTAIYAKVDITMLRELAQPWPTTEATP